MAMALLIGAVCLTSSVMGSAQESQVKITIIDLGLLPGGSMSSGLAINDQPMIVGLATDSGWNLQRPLWDANTGAVVGTAENMNPASTAIPEQINDVGEMAGTEIYGDNVYQGVYWNAAFQAFALPGMAGVDPFYGALHSQAHGINNLGQIVGTGKEAAPDYLTHAVLWPNKDAAAIDLGFLGQGIPSSYSVAYGINDSSHVVGSGKVGSLTRGFLWRNGQMLDLGALSGQVVSEAYAINNAGLIAGKSNFYPVTWEYDMADRNGTPTIKQLALPDGFFDGVPRAVNDSGDVVGYAGAPSIYSHAILWRNGVAIDLGTWPGGHYSVANGINDLGQIVGTGTVAGDNLDHALMWTVETCQADIGFAGPGTASLSMCGGDLSSGTTADLLLEGAAPHQLAILAVGPMFNPTPLLGGTAVPVPATFVHVFTTDPSGAVLLSDLPGGGGPLSFYAQFGYFDNGLPQNWGFSNALRIDFLP